MRYSESTQNCYSCPSLFPYTNFGLREISFVIREFFSLNYYEILSTMMDIMKIQHTAIKADETTVATHLLETLLETCYYVYSGSTVNARHSMFFLLHSRRLGARTSWGLDERDVIGAEPSDRRSAIFRPSPYCLHLSLQRPKNCQNSIFVLDRMYCYYYVMQSITSNFKFLFSFHV